MAEKITLRNSVGIVLNGIDIIVAGLLVLGGRAAMNSHPVAGYITMAMAPVLLYLSSGIWTKQNWKLISRIALYGGASLVFGISAVVLILARSLPVTPDTFVLCLVIGAFFVVALLSVVHLRLVRETLSATE